MPYEAAVIALGSLSTGTFVEELEDDDDMQGEHEGDEDDAGGVAGINVGDIMKVDVLDDDRCSAALAMYEAEVARAIVSIAMSVKIPGLGGFMRFFGVLLYVNG